MTYCHFSVTKCAPVKIINFQYFLDYIISYEVNSCSLELMLIVYSFFRVQGICCDRNMVFIGMFLDFIAKIWCFILQWILKFWGRGKLSQKCFLSFNTLNIALSNSSICLQHNCVFLYWLYLLSFIRYWYFCVSWWKWQISDIFDDTSFNVEWMHGSLNLILDLKFSL